MNDMHDEGPMGADVLHTPRPKSLDQHIVFPGNPYPSLGVEMELWLVDPHTGHLIPKADAVLEGFEGSPFAKPELFQSIVEINTDVCQTVEEVERELHKRLGTFFSITDRLGIGAMCTGTHPISAWRQLPISSDPRYQEFVASMGWPARRMLISGIHFHVGAKSGEHAVALMNALTVFVPHLLAVSASSPFWEGHDTNMASCRTKVFEGLPTAGIPPKVRNWGQFVSLMRTFLQANSITSIREIWWDVRPHPRYGTIEMRICDGINDLKTLLALAAFVQSLVDYLQDLYDHGEPLPALQDWTIRQNRWRAAKDGERAQIIRNEHGTQVPLDTHILEWVETLQPSARKLGCLNYLQTLPKILAAGPSYVHQRKAIAEGGCFESLIRNMTREFRDQIPS